MSSMTKARYTRKNNRARIFGAIQLLLNLRGCTLVQDAILGKKTGYIIYEEGQFRVVDDGLFQSILLTKVLVKLLLGRRVPRDDSSDFKAPVQGNAVTFGHELIHDRLGATGSTNKTMKEQITYKNQREYRGNSKISRSFLLLAARFIVKIGVKGSTYLKDPNAIIITENDLRVENDLPARLTYDPISVFNE